MAVLTPGGTVGWNPEVWEKAKFEPATYQRMKFIRTIDEGDRPYNLLHIRKHARVAGSVLGQSTAGGAADLTFLTIIGTPVTVTPVHSVVPVAYGPHMEAQTDGNLDKESASNIEMALAELTEASAAANIATLTTVISTADVDGTILRRAYGQLMGNTNGMAEPGGDTQVYGLFSHTQFPNLGNIPEFNQADIRGDSENPYVKGIWTKGGGIMLLMTTVVTQDGNGWHNGLYIPSCFVIAWNMRSNIVRDRDALRQFVIAQNNVGSAVKHDLRGIDIRTTANPL